MQYLKQSTAVTVQVGPFVDNTDGYTPETGLTISQADVRLSKNGAVFAQKNEASAATHDENGWYRCPLNTTDTNTLGRLALAVYESGALPVWHEYTVLPANTYDSLISGSDQLTVYASDIWDAEMDANAPAACNTAKEYMNVMIAALAGKTAGTGDWSARDLGDTKTRIQSTLTAAGARSSVDTLDGT